MVSISRFSNLQIEIDDKELDWLIRVINDKIHQLDAEGECIAAKRLEKIINDITRQTKTEK
jgi:hypothetical protein